MGRRGPAAPRSSSVPLWEPRSRTSWLRGTRSPRSVRPSVSRQSVLPRRLRGPCPRSLPLRTTRLPRPSRKPQRMLPRVDPAEWEGRDKRLLVVSVLDPERGRGGDTCFLWFFNKVVVHSKKKKKKKKKKVPWVNPHP